MHFGYRARIGADGIAPRGHVTIGEYTDLFDRATDALREHVGLGQDYSSRAHCGVYVVESHAVLTRGLEAGDEVRVDSLVLGVASKKMHVFHRALLEDDATAATVEFLLVHVDRGLNRAVPWPAEALDRLRALSISRTGEAIPPEAGRTISLNPARTR